MTGPRREGEEEESDWTEVEEKEAKRTIWWGRGLPDCLVGGGYWGIRHELKKNTRMATHASLMGLLEWHHPSFWEMSSIGCLPASHFNRGTTDERVQTGGWGGGEGLGIVCHQMNWWCETNEECREKEGTILIGSSFCLSLPPPSPPRDQNRGLLALQRYDGISNTGSTTLIGHYRTLLHSLSQRSAPNHRTKRGAVHFHNLHTIHNYSPWCVWAFVAVGTDICFFFKN